MADIEARVNENSPIGFFTWCWTIVVEITDGRIVSIRDPPGRSRRYQISGAGSSFQKIHLRSSRWLPFPI